MNIFNKLRGGHCLGLRGRGATQMENSPRFYWTTRIWRRHKMVHYPLIFLSEWRKFPSANCLAGKSLDETSVSILLKSHASVDMPPIILCKKKRLAIRQMKRPILPTTLSIQFYDIGNYVGLRTCQQLSYSTAFYVTVLNTFWNMCRGNGCNSVHV